MHKSIRTYHKDARGARWIWRCRG